MPGLTWHPICCTNISLINFGDQPTGWGEPQEWLLCLSCLGSQDKRMHSLKMLPVGNTINCNIIEWFSWMGKLAFHEILHLD